MMFFSSVFAVGCVGFFMSVLTPDSIGLTIGCICFMAFSMIGGSIYENKLEKRIKDLENQLEEKGGEQNAQ